MLTEAETELMVKQNEGLVRMICEKCIKAGMLNWQEREDIYQEGRISLWQAARKYNPEKGAFSSLACKYIMNAMLHINYFNSMPKRKPTHQPIYGNAMTHKNGDVSNTELWNYIPDATDIESEVLCITLDDIRKLALNMGYPQRSADWLLDSLKGETCGEIARRNGCTRSNVSFHVSKVRKDVAKELQAILE